MVFGSSSQIDEDGLKAKELIERAMAALGKPTGDFKTIVQTGDVQDAVATIETPYGLRTLKVPRIALGDYSEEKLVELIKRRLVAMYGRPATAA
ncbi:MAG TPA: hypothetical protein VM733_15215 [Thermoanaerobaculia bacterium]|nr:hypothetical protein [Thermoanaerobaculia bacterium]